MTLGGLLDCSWKLAVYKGCPAWSSNLSRETGHAVLVFLYRLAHSFVSSLIIVLVQGMAAVESYRRTSLS